MNSICYRKNPSSIMRDLYPLKNYYKAECVTGKFFRQFILPETVNTAKISAKHKNGVLILRLPKEEQKHSRKITIEATEENEDG